MLKIKIKVHVILDELDRQIVEVIRSFPGVEIVQWDYSFDTAYQWAMSNKEERVDVFLASEYAQVSNTDDHGKQISRDKALLKRIRDIFLTRPNVKFLLLCDPDRKRPGNREFLTNLVSIGIYDFKTEEVLTEELLEEFIKEPKRNIAHVAEFLPGGHVSTNSSHNVKQFEFEEDEEEEEEEETIRSLLKQKIIDKLKKPSKPRKGIKIRKSKKKEAPKKEEAPTVEQEPQSTVSSVGVIYSLELGLDRGVVNFNTWEQLLSALDIVTPNVIILSSETSDLIGKIEYLKNNYNTSVVIIGDASNEVLKAGADAYYREWDSTVYERLVDGARTRDSLTGLYDRNYFEISLDRQVYLYQNQRRPFSILLISIDSFGSNDSQKVLIDLANFLSSNVNATDIVARYGDKEFAVIFPNTTKNIARQRSEELRSRWHRNRQFEITFSGGLATFGEDGSTAKELVSNANRALTKSKRSGKDKISIAGEKAKKSPISILKSGRMRAQVIVVVGAAPRVGATSFCLALAKYLSRNNIVEVVDAGGGAYDWVIGGEIKVRRTSPLSITPGVITLIDAGHEITEEIQPYANMVFLVTDMSRNSVYFKDYIEKSNSLILVGNRGASLEGLYELGDLWEINVLGTLSEELVIKEAEIDGQIVVPKRWIKELKKVRGFIK